MSSVISELAEKFCVPEADHRVELLDEDAKPFKAIQSQEAFAPIRKVPKQILRISSSDRTCFEFPATGACMPEEFRE